MNEKITGMKTSTLSVSVVALIVGLVVGFLLDAKLISGQRDEMLRASTELAMVTAASQLKANVLLLEILERQDYESARVLTRGNLNSILIMLKNQKSEISPVGQVLVDDAIKEATNLLNSTPQK